MCSQCCMMSSNVLPVLTASHIAFCGLLVKTIKCQLVIIAQRAGKLHTKKDSNLSSPVSGSQLTCSCSTLQVWLFTLVLASCAAV